MQKFFTACFWRIYTFKGWKFEKFCFYKISMCLYFCLSVSMRHKLCVSFISRNALCNIIIKNNYALIWKKKIHFLKKYISIPRNGLKLFIVFRTTPAQENDSLSYQITLSESKAIWKKCVRTFDFLRKRINYSIT